MPKCAVKSCRNNTLTTQKKDGVTYHRFPLHEIKREKWRKLVARERSEESYKPNESSVICSSHFHESDIYYTNKGYKRIKKTAVPHLEFKDGPEISLEEPELFEQSNPSDVLIEIEIVKKEPPFQQDTADDNTPQDDDVIPTQSLPTASSPVLDNVEARYYKRELKKCNTKLDFKDRQVRNLKKQNKRLRIQNSSLKEIIKKLKNQITTDL